MIGPSEAKARICTLADGRVLFLAAARAYYLEDQAHGQRLERRLKSMLHGSTAAVIGALLAATWAETWWLALLAVPAFLVAVLSEFFVVIGLQEATDPGARAEVNRHSMETGTDLGGKLIWTAIALLAAIGPAYLRGRTKTPMQLVEIGLFGLAFVVAVAHFWRQRRGRRERELIGEPRRADNRPIVPR